MSNHRLLIMSKSNFPLHFETDIVKERVSILRRNSFLRLNHRKSCI